MLKVADFVYPNRQRSGNKKATIPGQITKWSVRFDWVARAQAHDARDEMLRREVLEEYEKADAQDYARRIRDLHERNLRNEERAAELESKYLDRVEQLLDELPLVQQRVVRKENGVPVAYVVKPATKDAVLDVLRLHKIATRNEPTKVDLTSDGEEIQIIEYTWQPSDREEEEHD